MRDMASETTVKANETEVKTSQTSTVLEAYDAIVRHRAFERLRALKGKIHLDIDIDELRGRNR
jgi:hypothetical protein